MTRDVEYGDPLSVPLGAQEFRWRPYGYLERRAVPDPDTRGSKPGPVVMALLHPDLDAAMVAKRRGGRWAVRTGWRWLLDPAQMRKFWTALGALVLLIAASLTFLATVGRLDGAAPLVAAILVGLAAGALVVFVGQSVSEKALEEARAKEEFAVLWLNVLDDGYGELALHFDQVAEAWSRGRVLDQSWEEVGQAVIAALEEYAAHRTPADKANPEYLRAMKVLDTVRTNLGRQGLG